MSLYYDAASILSDTGSGGSLKSRIYNNRDTKIKSHPAQIYALISECSRYDVLLKEIIDNAGILSHEHKLTPLLSVLLVHDHLFSKGGIAAPTNHPLRLAIDRHKARIQAELTKARIRRKCATVDELKKAFVAVKQHTGSHLQPRWARVNRIKLSLKELLQNRFPDYEIQSSLAGVMSAAACAKILHCDENIPDLIAFPPGANVAQTAAYESGEVIIQEKASCFPAFLLLGDVTNAPDQVGDVMDACAAPGNKTTHLAALLHSDAKPKADMSGSRIFACERDPGRSKTLQNMVSITGTTNSVQVLAKQDFLALDFKKGAFENVTHLLLDPSCSGSGIMGREDIPQLVLPGDPRTSSTTGNKLLRTTERPQGSLKRKREQKMTDKNIDSRHHQPTTDKPAPPTEEETFRNTTALRLQKLSNLQTRIIEHAMAFPAALRITYSTCSMYAEENENVVARALTSRVGQERGWRLLQREEQVQGLREWPHRGMQKRTLQTASNVEPGGDDVDVPHLSTEDQRACLRCHPGTKDGTMGFFLCAFVRTARSEVDTDEAEWEGLGD